MTNNPLYRPPAEAWSVILQTDVGCPYNRCTFCGMYDGVPYRRRALDEIRQLVEREASMQPDATRVFLADGDVMRRPVQELTEILQVLGRAFPSLARVNTYATGRAILAKSDQDLTALRALKLHTLYMGLESGDDATLRAANKAETADEMVEAGQRASGAGLRMSVMILLGLGGRPGSSAHAAATADALNRMRPRLLSALRVVPVPGTPLHQSVQAGTFEMVSEQGIVRELLTIVERLDLRGTVFRADHSSNVVPLEARLPRDRSALIAQLKQLLDSGALDAHGPGPLPMWL